MKNRCSRVCFQISITSACQELAALQTCGICWVCLCRALPRKLLLPWELIRRIPDSGNGQGCCLQHAEGAHLDLSSSQAQNCWCCTAAGSPSRELLPEPQLLSSRLVPKVWWQRGGDRPWVTAATPSCGFSSSARPGSLSPATACVLRWSSLSRGEQRESQRPHERTARTDRSRGPTPPCPTAESEGEEERESVQKGIIHPAAQPPLSCL